MTVALERLAAAGIRILPTDSIETHWVLERDGFVALVERATGAIGTPGRLTDGGLAMLLWRGERAFFVAKSYQREAGPDEVAALRQFSADLAQALSGLQLQQLP
ncbi:MAG: hypothetical protein ACRD96_21825 [Bryobacteraceae bacterium]